MTVIELVIFVLVCALVLYFVKWLVGAAQIPEPASRIVIVVVGVILLLIFLQRIGLLSHGGPVLRLGS